MDMTRIVLEALWDDLREAGPFLLVTVVLASVMCAIAAVRNEPTLWRDIPGGMFWGWLAGMTFAVGFVIASAVIEEIIRRTYDFKNWFVLLLWALGIFGPICLAACYLTAGWWFRRRIKQRRLRAEQGLPILPHRWYAISLRTLLLVQLVVFLLVGGWYSGNRSSLEHRYWWKQHRAWQANVHARFAGYGWHLNDVWKPLRLLCNQPLVNFDDHVLEKLQPSDRLQTLYIDSDQLTNVGLKTIAEQQDLEQLSIKATKVTDVGLAQLVKLPKLRRVTLDCPALTDAALEQLQKYPALTDLYIKTPDISREAAEKFRTARPEVDLLVRHPWTLPKTDKPSSAGKM